MVKRLHRKRIQNWRIRVRQPAVTDLTQPANPDQESQSDSDNAAGEASDSSISDCVRDLRPIELGAVSTFSKAPYVRAVGSKKQRIERWREMQEYTPRKADRKRLKFKAQSK